MLRIDPPDPPQAYEVIAALEDKVSDLQYMIKVLQKDKKVRERFVQQLKKQVLKWRHRAKRKRWRI